MSSTSTRCSPWEAAAGAGSTFCCAPAAPPRLLPSSRSPPARHPLATRSPPISSLSSLARSPPANLCPRRCANLYSLLNLEAHTAGILDKCLAAGMGVVIGGPYSSGILATGADPPDGRAPMYNYQIASAAVRTRTRGIEAVCARHGVPLIAAALQVGH